MNVPDLNTKRILHLAMEKGVKEKTIAEAIGDVAQNFNQKKKRAGGNPPIPLEKLPTIAKLFKMDLHDLLEELREDGNPKAFQEERPHYGKTLASSKDPLSFLQELFLEKDTLSVIILDHKEKKKKS